MEGLATRYSTNGASLAGTSHTASMGGRFTDSSIIITEAMQHWIWEQGSEANDTCDLNGPTNEPCHQGNVPIYSVTATGFEHVKAAILFAKRFNLRVVIKNTGHDGCGRSAARNSLQINTHNLKGIRFYQRFMPKGAASTQSIGPVVTIGAGTMHWELYESCVKEGYIVVGGECPTVGIGGGFLLGGGVSRFLNHAKGLAVDNVVEFEMVTADGVLVTANKHQNADLFWALRGGGGGTYGVVTRVTLLVHPDVPAVLSSISLSTSSDNSRADQRFWEQGVAGLLTILRRCNHANIAGQFILDRPSFSVLRASLALYFLGHDDVTAVEEQVRQAVSLVIGSDNTSRMLYNLSSQSLSRISGDSRMKPDIHPQDDYGIIQGSMLISEKLFNSLRGPHRIATALSKLELNVTDILFTNNLGGRVNTPEDIETSMHPAWRSSAHLLSYVKGVPPAPPTQRHIALQDLHAVQMPILYSLEPESRVSYANIGDPSEDNFRKAYWGDKYDRLAQIKRRWDRYDLFMVRHGVGSDDWDDRGMCRIMAASSFWLAVREMVLSRWTALGVSARHVINRPINERLN